MSATDFITCTTLLEESDQILLNEAYKRIIRQLSWIDVTHELIMIAGDIVDTLQDCGVAPEWMSLPLFVEVAGPQALTDLISRH